MGCRYLCNIVFSFVRTLFRSSRYWRKAGTQEAVDDGQLEVPEPDIAMTTFYHREAEPLGPPVFKSLALVLEHTSLQQEESE